MSGQAALSCGTVGAAVPHFSPPNLSCGGALDTVLESLDFTDLTPVAYIVLLEYGKIGILGKLAIV